MFLLGASWSLLQLYRRAHGSERQQIAWITYAVGLLALISPTATMEFPWHLPASLLFILVLVAAGIAVFRHRLYDIDFINRRSLVHSVFTVLMALIHYGTVVLFQHIFRTLTGQGSQIPVVASTLTFAALFNPLRRQTQELIDRRFNR